MEGADFTVKINKGVYEYRLPGQGVESGDHIVCVGVRIPYLCKDGLSILDKIVIHQKNIGARLELD